MEDTLHAHQRKNYEEEVSIWSIYASNARGPTCIKETLVELNTHIKPQTLIVLEFNTPLSSLGRSLKQEVNSDTLKQTADMKQIDLTDIYRTIHAENLWTKPPTTECIWRNTWFLLFI